jgi:hypothetical protein
VTNEGQDQKRHHADAERHDLYHAAERAPPEIGNAIAPREPPGAQATRSLEHKPRHAAGDEHRRGEAAEHHRTEARAFGFPQNHRSDDRISRGISH